MQLLVYDIGAFGAVGFMIMIFFHTFLLKQAEGKYGLGSGDLRQVYQEQIGWIVFWFGGLAVVIFLMLALAHI